MIHYPDTDCKTHYDVRTAEPVCLVCLIEERDRLRDRLEDALVKLARQQPQGGEDE